MTTVNAEEDYCDGWCGKKEIWDCSDRHMCKTCHFKKEDELYDNRIEEEDECDEDKDQHVGEAFNMLLFGTKEELADEEHKEQYKKICDEEECDTILDIDTPIMCYMNKQNGDKTLCRVCYEDGDYQEDDENSDNEDEDKEEEDPIKCDRCNANTYRSHQEYPDTWQYNYMAYCKECQNGSICDEE